MKKMEPYLKEWYDYLKQGKIMGVKCPRCGGVEFPPVPVCNSCGCTDVEWVEMSGNATVETFTYSPMGIPPYTTDEVMCCFVRMEEGPVFTSWLLDQHDENQDELFERMPLAVKAEVKKINEEHDIWFPVFRVKE